MHLETTIYAIQKFETAQNLVSFGQLLHFVCGRNKRPVSWCPGWSFIFVFSNGSFHLKTALLSDLRKIANGAALDKFNVGRPHAVVAY